MLKKKVKAMGGIFFITITLLMSIILTYTVRFSMNSSVSAIIDNISYLVCTEVAMYSYQTNEGSYIKNGSVDIRKPERLLEAEGASSETYNVVSSFNNRLREYAGSYIVSGSQTCKVEWNSNFRTATLTLGPIQTNWGSTIYPKEQMTIIEDK